MRVGAACLILLFGCGHEPPQVEEPPPGDPVQEVPAEDLFIQGVVLAQRGDLVRAEQYLASALDRGHPENRVMPVLLRVLVAASRLRVALDYAVPYLERNPDDWALRYLVASIHLGMGNAALARRELERVVETAPDQADPHYLLGIVLRDEMGDPTAAEAHFRRYLELAPEGGHADEVRDALRRIQVRLPAATPETPSPEPAGGSEDEPTEDDT